MGTVDAHTITADIDVRARLSWVWVFVLLNMFFADIFSFMNADLLRQIMDGRKDQMVVTPEFLLAAAVVTAFPIAMVVLSQVLPTGANRWANVTVAVPASDWPAIGMTHHAMASFRAVENGFSLVRAARWGVSGVVDPYGRTLSITDHRSPGADAAVALVGAGGLHTIYARVGDAFAWLCVAATGVAVGWALIGAMGAI